MFTAMFQAVLNWSAIEKKKKSKVRAAVIWSHLEMVGSFRCKHALLSTPTFLLLFFISLPVVWHIQECLIWFVRRIMELIWFSSKFKFVCKLPSTFFLFSSPDNPLTFPLSPLWIPLASQSWKAAVVKYRARTAACSEMVFYKSECGVKPQLDISS